MISEDDYHDFLGGSESRSTHSQEAFPDSPCGSVRSTSPASPLSPKCFEFILDRVDDWQEFGELKPCDNLSMQPDSLAPLVRFPYLEEAGDIGQKNLGDDFIA